MRRAGPAAGTGRPAPPAAAGDPPSRPRATGLRTTPIRPPRDRGATAVTAVVRHGYRGATSERTAESSGLPRGAQKHHRANKAEMMAGRPVIRDEARGAAERDTPRTE